MALAHRKHRRPRHKLRHKPWHHKLKKGSVKMAKRRTSLTLFKSASAPVAMAPRRGRGRVRRAAVGGLRRVARGGRTVAREHAVPAMGMAIGGAIAGALDAKGIFNKLPAIAGSRALTLALAGYAATRFVKNNTVRMAGLAAIAVGAFDSVKAHMTASVAPAVHAAVPAVHGHDDASGQTGDGGPY